MAKILFICTGNTCRSPMAEAFMRQLAAERGIPVEVKSAGVAAGAGQPMSKHAEAVLQSQGIDGVSFQSSIATGELVAWADLILTMTANHKRYLLEQFPSAMEKTYVLKEYALQDTHLAQLQKDHESLAAELQLKTALQQTITEEERKRLMQLELQMPNFDISDPYGGSREMYEYAAKEIKHAIEAVLRRLTDR